MQIQSNAANSRLIAAAPEMYEALSELYQAVIVARKAENRRALTLNAPYPRAEREALFSALEKAEAVMSKARHGEWHTMSYTYYSLGRMTGVAAEYYVQRTNKGLYLIFKDGKRLYSSGIYSSAESAQAALDDMATERGWKKDEERLIS